MARNLEINQHVSGLERALENALGTTFRPVGPRPEYLDHLRQRLMDEPERGDEDEQVVNAMLASIGVVSAVLLIVASVRWIQNRRNLNNAPAPGSR